MIGFLSVIGKKTRGNPLVHYTPNFFWMIFSLDIYLMNTGRDNQCVMFLMAQLNRFMNNKYKEQWKST